MTMDICVSRHWLKIWSVAWHTLRLSGRGPVLGLLGIGLQCTMQKPMNGNCHQVVVLAESVVSAQWFFGSLQLQQDTKE